jgi:hypothetical protein
MEAESHLLEEIILIKEELRRIAGRIGDLEISYGGKTNQRMLEEWRQREVVVRRILARAERELLVMQQ